MYGVNQLQQSKHLLYNRQINGHMSNYPQVLVEHKISLEKKHLYKETNVLRRGLGRLHFVSYIACGRWLLQYHDSWSSHFLKHILHIEIPAFVSQI